MLQLVVTHAMPACMPRRLQNGTTYNAYLIFGEKTALVDASHEKFRGLFMQALKAQLAKAGRSLDYILVSHTEPDHSGALLQHSPCRTPCCPPPGATGMLQDPPTCSKMPGSRATRLSSQWRLGSVR